MPNDWKVPSLDSPTDTKLGWAAEAISEGEGYLRAQRAYKDFDTAIDIIAGSSTSNLAPYRSTVRTGRLKRNIREAVSTLSDLRPMWGYQTDNRDLYNRAMVLNKLSQSWYLSTFADRGIRKSLQWATVMGTGWASPVYRPDDWLVGKGDIFLETYGPRDVVVIQPTRDNNHQRAYAVGIRNEVPIAYAHAMYPTYAHLIVPDREAPSTLRRGMEKVQRFLSPVLNAFGVGQKKESSPALFPMVDIWHWYIQDTAMNLSGSDVWMGEPGTSWHYKVPSYGSTAEIREANGNVSRRKVDYEDARLFPLRRLMICTSTCIPYDNTSHYWHGKVPLIKFTVDDWPWEPSGFSMVRDADTIQKSIDDNVRRIDDTLAVRPAPPMAYDSSTIPKSTMERLDTRRPNTKIGLNMSMGEGLKPIVSAEYYTVDAAQFEHVRAQEERLDHIHAIRDMLSLAKGRTAASPDSLEKIMELAGPIIKDISRGMEASIRDLGEMNKSNFFQFYTTARKIQLIGKDAVTEEDYDYEPGNMIPSHMPEETQAKKDRLESKFTEIERARYWKDQFAFKVTPYSLHQINQLSRKLIYLQLQKAGQPMDPWTLAEIFDVPNMGSAPEGANTIIERWMAWEDMKVERQIELAQIMQEAGMGAPGGGGQPGEHRGRKPSGNAAPALKQKDGGSRSTVTESK